MMILLLLASIPVFVFFLTIYFRDKEREPLSNIIKCFLGGLGAAIITIVVLIPFEKIVLLNPLFNSVFNSFLYAAIPEELFKFLFLYLLIWKNRHFDQYYDGIVYAVAVSLGFAWIENIFYVLEHGIGTAIVRALLSVPGHGLFGVVMGYFFALAKFNHNNKYLWKAVLYPILFHGMFNSILSYTSHVNLWIGILLFLLLLLFVVYIWKIGINKIKELVSKDNK
jgi:protease PrsW